VINRRPALAAAALALAGYGGSTEPNGPGPTRSPAPTTEIAVGSGACGLAAAGGAVWATALEDNQVVRIDPRGPAVAQAWSRSAATPSPAS
jgi:hypothetical protein